MTLTNRRAVRLRWRGEGLWFTGEGTDPVTPSIDVDGDGARGPSPMLTLLLAAAACSGSDVVHILQKMRVTVREVTVNVEGMRRDEDPRRYVSMRFYFRLSGEGLDRAKGERAIQLSLDKYCSVVHSLAPDLELGYELELA